MNLNAAGQPEDNVEAQITWALLVFSSCNSFCLTVGLKFVKSSGIDQCCLWILACLFCFSGEEDQLDMIYSSPEGKLKSSGSSFMKGIGSKCFVFKFTCYWEFIGKKKKQWREYAIKIVLWGLKRWLSG